MNKNRKPIIGIDEVGRGPLAGPVVVCAVAILSGFRFGITKCRGAPTLVALRDSKKLTAKQREAWYKHATNHPRIRYAVARVYPRKIEQRNITQAANLAAVRAFAQLNMRRTVKNKKAKIYLDGGLYLKNKTQSAELGAQTIIKGDERIPAIALASIIAKVIRDRYMARLARVYPSYGFDRHKGYGTRAHRAAIRRHGPTAAHRKTFLARRPPNI